MRNLPGGNMGGKYILMKIVRDVSPPFPPLMWMPMMEFLNNIWSCSKSPRQTDNM